MDQNNRSNEELNKEIAYWLGWEYQESTSETGDSDFFWTPKDEMGMREARENIPDFCNDLDAIHIVEENLNAEQRDQYENLILDMAENNYDWTLLHATARQRAEALVKVIQTSYKNE